MRTTTLGLSIACAIGGFAYARQAQAATTYEYSVIILDQTGSMNDPGTVAGTPQNGMPVGANTMFDNSITAAINWVYTDMTASDVAGGRKYNYAIYTFKDDTCCGGTQGKDPVTSPALRKIWPSKTKPTLNCSGTATGTTSHYVATDGFCYMDGDDGYSQVIDILNSLRKQQVASGQTIGGDPNGLLSSIDMGKVTDKGGASYDTENYGMGPNTPLATSLCQAVDNLKIASGTQYLTLTLETDGNENYSAYESLHACAGAGDTSTQTSFTKTVADWGQTAGSWQNNVTRRIVRLVSAPPSATNTLAQNDVQQTTAINLTHTGFGSAIVPSSSTLKEDVPSQSAWRVDVHYSICDTAYAGSPAPCTPVTSSAVAAPLATMHALLSSEQPVLYPVPVVLAVKTTTSAASMLAVASTTAAATSSTRTQSISPTEIGFYSALGKVNSRSSFRTFVRDPVTSPTRHIPKIPGDVDDSGCTDSADFRILTQKDVYYQKAVQPNQLAIRADLDGDQWVTKADALVVLANWGKGCINPVGPKPVLKY